MKHVLFILFALLGIAYSCSGPNPAEGKETLTAISVDSVKNVGLIPYGKEYKIEFNVLNSGKNALLIHNVEPSCGCTHVNYSKKPVKPGNTEIIEVYYDAKSFGRFSKQVKVFCNTSESIHILTFKGETRDEETK